MAEVIGFVGVGDMGGPMARNLLQAGFEAAAYDIRADALDAVASAGARAASSASEVASAAQIVMVSLNTVAAAHAVAAEAAAGTAIEIFVDLSTTGPSVAREVRRHFAGSNIEMLDAPVSGLIADAIAQGGATERSSAIFKFIEAKAGIAVGEDD